MTPMPARRFAWQPLLAAIAASLCAAAAQWALTPLIGHRPFLMFFFATSMATAAAGRTAGLLTLLAGFAYGTWLVVPAGLQPLLSTVGTWTLYGLVSTGIVLAVDRQRRTSRRAEQAEARAAVQWSDLQALHDLSTRLIHCPAVDDQLEAALETLCGLLDADHGTVSLRDDATGKLELRASRGFKPENVQQLRRIGFGSGEADLARNHRVALDNVQAEPEMASYHTVLASENLHSLLCVPLIGGDGQTIGYVTALWTRSLRADERMKRLADLVARKVAVHADRARAGAAARLANDRLVTALEASTIAFGVLEAIRNEGGDIVDYRWLQANAAGAALCKRSGQSLVGLRLSEVLPQTTREAQLIDRFAQVESSGETWVHEHKTLRDSGVAWLELIVSKVPGGIATWVNDVTQHRRQAEALERADRRKDEFLATLAHELRNPLAPIRQATLIAKSEQATEAQKRWSTDVIERQVGHMAMLLDDLLDVSRITRGKLPLRRKEVDLREVVERALESARPLIDAKRHVLSLRLPGEPLWVHVDVLRLSQVLTNVLANAAKYTAPGGRIGLAAARDGHEAVLLVTDNGVGIAAQDIDHVFEMFTQAGGPPQPSPNASDAREGGLGIGLALARGLVELHGGRISAASAGPGRGSEFTIRLPLPATVSAAAPAECPAIEHVAPRRVLVADDNRDAADSLAEVLRLQGHDVAVAYDGDDAVSQFDTFHPDVALLDIGMPRRNGHQVAEAIRSSASGQQPLLVAVTGWGQERDRERSMAAGFDHHLTKPVDPRKLNRLMADAPNTLH